MASSSLPSSTACVQFRTEQLELSDCTPLGSGAISHVVQCRLHSAENPSLPVVVKIVSKLQVLQQGKVRSIMNEKTALQRLGPHPYIARLFGTSQSEDELYYVLEWLPHGDLLQHIRRVHSQRVRAYNAAVRPTNATRAASATSIPSSSTALRCLDFHDIQLIAAQLVLALARASAKGVVLRDLKPENVAFDEKHRACLLDFDTVDLDGAAATPETNGGVACPPPCDAAVDESDEDKSGVYGDGHTEGGAATSAASTSASSSPLPPQRRRLTVSEIQGMRKKSASFCGTAQYVSPEMVGECKWSFSSDLWALGALVYEMAYGVHLFTGMSQFEVLEKVIQGNYVERAGLFPLIDFGEYDDATCKSQSRFAAFKDFVQKLLNVDPSQRLGVSSETHRFDEAALRGHAFFRGFAWDIVDAQLHTFRARSFQASGSKGTASPQFGRSRSAFDKASEKPRDSESDEDDIPNEASVAATAAVAKAALEDLLTASVDPSPSLAARYHAAPFNDPAYAEYVYRATADANPFEKFFLDASTKAKAPSEMPAAAAAAAVKPANDARCVAAPSAGKVCGSAPSLLSTAVNVRAEPEAAELGAALAADGYGTPNDDKDGEEDDVIDDVGMQYVGPRAHADFHE